MAGLSSRIFGSDIPIKVREKLEARQKLARANPGESVNQSYSMPDDIATSFGGQAELSSKTPFVRMWTSVQLSKFNKDEDGVLDKQYPTEPISREIYIIGNNVYNQGVRSPHDSMQQRKNYPEYGVSPSNDLVKSVMPKEFTTDDNEFLQPPAGIISVDSSTEGIGAIKKTSVKFKVFNFPDYEAIYHRYFLRPGATIFIDFGWDTNDVYDPEMLLHDIETLDEILYGPDGYVTKSGGDLETVLGNVVDFSSQLNDDGSIDCSIDIVSENVALLGTNLHKGEALKIKEKIIFALDYMIINYAVQAFGEKAKAVFQPDKARNYDNIEEWTTAAEVFAAKTLGLSSDNVGRDETLIKLRDKYDIDFEQSDMLRALAELDIKRFPSVTSKLLGVFWAPEAGNIHSIKSNSKNLFISWGLFEDMILNHEFGLGHDYENILTGTNSVRFDSSNSFMRLDPNLLDRQTNPSTDMTQLSFIYPGDWAETYNTHREKIPEYPTDYSEIEDIMTQQGMSVTYETMEQTEMTNEEYTECIMNWEYQQFGFQTVNPNYYDQINYPGMTWLEGDENGHEDFRFYSGGPFSNPQNAGYNPVHHGEYPDLIITDNIAENPVLESNKNYQCGLIDAPTIKNVEFEKMFYDMLLNRIPLREVFFSVNIIKKAFLKHATISEIVREIFDTIKRDSYDIINLQISSNDYSGRKLGIIDQNYIDSIKDEDDSKGLFEFEVNSPNSICKSFDLSYSIGSDDYASMLAIQAMSGNSMFPMDDVLDMQLATKLLSEGELSNEYGINYLPDLGSYRSTQLDSSDEKLSSIEKKEKENKIFNYNAGVADSLTALFESMQGGFAIGEDDLKDVETYTKIAATQKKSEDDKERLKEQKVAGSEDFRKAIQERGGLLASTDYEYFGLKAKNDYFIENKSTLLPFECTLTTFGIASLAVGDTFNVNYLPSRYRDFTYFQVMGITHRVSNSDWSTELTTRMRMKPKVKEDSGIFKYMSNINQPGLSMEGFQQLYPNIGKNLKKLDASAIDNIIYSYIGEPVHWKNHQSFFEIMPQMKNLRPASGGGDKELLNGTIFNTHHTFTWDGSEGTIFSNELLKRPSGGCHGGMGFGNCPDNFEEKLKDFTSEASTEDLIFEANRDIETSYSGNFTYSWSVKMAVKLKSGQEYDLIHNGTDFIIVPDYQVLGTDRQREAIKFLFTNIPGDVSDSTHPLAKYYK